MERTWSDPTSTATAVTTVRATPSSATGTLAVALYAATLLLGSALIFVVEPMFAKMLLPRAGGSPAVWNTCLVFFQAALLVGYGYAHLTTRLGTLRTQVAVHLALLLLAVVALPVTVPADWAPPGDTSPVPWLLVTLTLRLGAPFLVLSATAPLLQKWFAGTDLPSARDPYHLYAASNIGSLLALLAYPLIIEPTWSLVTQGRGWTGAYVTFGLLVTGCGLIAIWRRAPAARVEAEAVADDATAVTWSERARWLTLSLVPSSLLLGVTTYLTTDIAAVPLLWTVPLALYLLTFVLAFARRRPIPDGVVRRAAPLLLTAVIVPISIASNLHLFLIPVHLLVFFGSVLCLHTVLASRRPATAHLTEFYLWIAVGGVAGGLLNTFVAPLVFDGVFEYLAALVATCFLLPRQDERGFTRADVLLPLAVGVAAVSLTFAAQTEILTLRPFAVLAGALALVCFSFSRRPLRFGLAVGSLVLATNMLGPTGEPVLAADRTFFGVLRVRHDTAMNRHVLMHGSTMHGYQSLDPARRLVPQSYYHRSGPVGQLMTAFAPRLENARVAVIGLGAGALAAYVRPGQQWTFYEIDPAVARIARDPAMFTFLRECGAQCDVVLGDARLSLGRADGPDYELLVLDAFSSDAIPVHLITREALGVYLSRLAPDGVIAFHISNRHLRLRPVVTALAAERGLTALVQLDTASTSPPAEGHTPSEWMLMTRRPETFAALAADRRWQRPAATAGTRVWTDDFSNILSVLKTEWR